MTRESKAILVFSFLSTMLVGCFADTADSSIQTELLERLMLLEKQGQQQAGKMLTMDTRLEEQEKAISDYKQRVAELEQTVAEMRHKQDPGLSDKDHYKQRVAELEQTVSELLQNQDTEADEHPGVMKSGSNQVPVDTRQERSEPAENRAASMRIRRALLNAEGPVSFHAVIKAGHVEHLGLNQNIVFPDVMLNLGGGYHNQHGVFIAPQPGVYIFSTSIMAQDIPNHDEIYVHLNKNGQILANAYADAETGRFDQGSVTVVTQLVAGDEVWVSLYGPGTDVRTYGNSYDSFMGCLVIPL